MCSDTSSTVFTYDVSGTGGQSSVVMVTGYAGDRKVQAWGSYDDVLFCCESGPNWDGSEVEIEGSPYGDLLKFGYDAGTWYLHHAVSGWGTPITKGTVNGNDGNDNIVGSSEASTSYTDYLYGDDDSDTIAGFEGDDWMEGGAASDTMSGGPGADDMFGQDGTDTMTGGPGNDNMWGGNDRDFMSGGGEDDVMNGGAGGDVMCGDGEGATGDYLNDGDTVAEANPDQLWAAIAADYLDVCGSASTYWDGNAPAACSGPTLNDKPELCS